jgi:hypothetical protein
MRTADEDTWEAEQWDEYLKEFGRAAYIEARYELAPRKEEWEWTREAGRQETVVPNAA